MITIESRGNNIFLFGRYEDKQPYIKVIENFLPYFYIEDKDGMYLSIDGKKLTKITCENIQELTEKKEKYKNHYEGDIFYGNRFIIDNPQYLKKEPIRKCYLDIEVARTEEGYESADKANNPILMIGCYDSFDNQHTEFVLNDFNNESEMLIKFAKYLNYKDPDMIIAWNGDNFDFPFLINRFTKLNLNPALMARQYNLFTGNCIADNYKTKIQGRVLFDLMYAYKKWSSGEGRESWSLNYISRYEKIGEKVEYKGELDDLYKNDINKFIEYNRKDVELLVKLDEKLRLVEFFDEMRIICCCKFEDVFMNSRMADCLCLKYAKDNRFVLPSIIKHNISTYQGGYVVESIPGLHKQVACMDMKSLYPSIMIGFNTSYETYLNEKQDDCISIDNIYYSKQPGIIPNIVKPLLDERKRIVINMNKVEDKHSREYRTLWMLQHTLKTIANSFYGVLGFPKFRLYKKEVANSITYIARKIIKEVHRWFEEKGFKVVYGDTDSCYVNMGDKSIEEFIQLNKEINEYFKTYFKQFNIDEKNNIFKLEFERVCKTIFFKMGKDKKGVKKKYVARVVWEDGMDVDSFFVRGFESRRSDSPQIGRDFLNQVLKLIVWEKDKNEIDDYINDFKTKIKTEFTPEQIALPTTITKPLDKYKNQIHARASRLANQKHKADIKQGDKIKYLYINHIDKVIAFKTDGYLWDGYQVNYDRMSRRIVDMKVAGIYDSLGWRHNFQVKTSNKKVKIKLLKDILKQQELW